MSLDHLRKRLTRIEQQSGMGPNSLGRTPALWIVTRDDADRDRQLADLAAAGEYQPDQRRHRLACRAASGTAERNATVTVIDLRRRLERIEAERHTGAPTRVMADYPITDEEADAALVNWRIRVARGEASLRNGVLYLTGSEMTADEWAAQHVTAH